jgi:hypothetical protein
MEASPRSAEVALTNLKREFLERLKTLRLSADGKLYKAQARYKRNCDRGIVLKNSDLRRVTTSTSALRLQTSAATTNWNPLSRVHTMLWRTQVQPSDSRSATSWFGFPPIASLAPLRPRWTFSQSTPPTTGLPRKTTHPSQQRSLRPFRTLRYPSRLVPNAGYGLPSRRNPDPQAPGHAGLRPVELSPPSLSHQQGPWTGPPTNTSWIALSTQSTDSEMRP